MGRHADEGRKRGVAVWPIVIAVAVLLVGGLIATYFIWLRSDQGSGAIDQRCTGSVRLEIAVGEGSAAAMATIAEAFNATNPAARGSCLTAEVSVIESAVVADALINGWTGQANPEPAVWIPDNASDLNLVSAQAPNVVAGHNDDPIATSRVVLALRRGDAASFPATLGWADVLSGAAAGTPPTLAGGLPLTLALGDPRRDRATGYALESMLAGPTGASVTVEQVAAAGSSLSALFASSAYSAKAGGLLGDLASGGTAFNAVAVLESALIRFNATASAPLTAVSPAGPTAGDSMTAIGLTAEWVNATRQEGGAALISYLRSPAAITLLQRSGLRVPGAPTGTATATSAAPAQETSPRNPATQLLPAAGPGVAQALATAFGLPTAEPSPPATTAPPATPAGNATGGG